MKFILLIFVVLLPLSVLAEKTTIKMSVREGQLRYSIEAFTVKPGADVEIVFHNNDHEMMHNIVICENKPGILNEVGMAAVMLADKAEAMKYVPNNESILFASDLVAADETITFSFVAPNKEGDYPFVCTLPGHFMTMRGVMTVSNKQKVVASPLYNLTYKHYPTLPPKASVDTFAAFENPAIGEVDDGLLNLMVTNLDGDPNNTKPFAVAFSGQLLIPAAGTYRFTLDMIGMVDVRLGEKVLFKNGNGRKTIVQHSDELQLKRGIYPFQFNYLAYHGAVFRKRSLRSNVKLSLKHPDGRYELLTKEMTQPVGAPTMLSAEKETVYVFRSAIEGSGPSSIHVGYDDGVSYSFDTKTCLLTQAWSDGFVDAAGDWAGRGGQGSKIVGERFFQVKQNVPAFLVGDQQKGPTLVRFRSYRLADDGAPVFTYLVSGISVTLSVERRGASLIQKMRVEEAGIGLAYLHQGEVLRFVKSGTGASLEIEVAP